MQEVNLGSRLYRSLFLLLEESNVEALMNSLVEKRSSRKNISMDRVIIITIPNFRLLSYIFHG